MKIGLAQVSPVKGNVAANITAHKTFIERAVSLQASAIFFPELSLTGYEPKLAQELACSPDDKRLGEFIALSNSKNIVIGVGLPTKSESGIFISMLFFQPGIRPQIYSKQELHSDELPYFKKGVEQLILTIDNNNIAPAICYESLQPQHARQASEKGAKIYLASVAKSHNGISKVLGYYPTVAKKYAMPVLMANCVGYCDNFMSVGQTAAWTKKGELAGQLNAKNEGILIFDTDTEEVIHQVQGTGL